MIISLTLNPALDKTLLVRQLKLGTVNRVVQSQLDPGGKGINVSRVLHRLGRATIAFGFLAGNIGAIASRALDEEGVAHRFAWVTGETRLNVIVVDEAGGQSTNLYDEGPTIDAKSREALLADVTCWLDSARVLVAAGSLPPGVPSDVYAHILREASRRGVRTILDADGETLRLGVVGRPDVIKPNTKEAEAMLGRPLPDVDAVVAAARELLASAPRAVVISMGSRGSICATPGRVIHALPPKVERRSTVGSGDSLVAGLAIALAEGKEIVDGLRLGTAAGAATAMTTGTALGTPEDIERLLPAVDLRDVA
jgi:1-phosphofructokinase family hexose kinase